MTLTLNAVFITIALNLLLHQPVLGSQSFLYFAYGSNLLKERIAINNPSATLHSIARLQNYKLVFGNHNGTVSKRWHGGVASIKPSTGDTVWGVVWKINTVHMDNLDRQEGVKAGVYSPVPVAVWTHGQTLTCRTYIMNNLVPAPPSPPYVQVIIMGAEQNGLPRSYLDKLRTIKTNTFDGHLPVMDQVNATIRKSKKGSN